MPDSLRALQRCWGQRGFVCGLKGLRQFPTRAVRRSVRHLHAACFVLVSMKLVLKWQPWRLLFPLRVLQSSAVMALMQHRVRLRNSPWNQARRHCVRIDRTLPLRYSRAALN